MRQFGRVLTFGFVAATFVALTTTDIALAQKKKVAPEPAAMESDYKAIQKQKELFGKLVAIDGGTKMVTIRVDYSQMEANPNFKPPTNNNPKGPNYNPQASQQYQMWKTQQDLQIQMQKAALAKTPREAQQAQQRIAQDMAKLQQQYQQQMAQAAKGVKNPGQANPNNSPFITVTKTKDFDLELQDKVVTRRLVLPYEFDDTGKEKIYTDKEKADMRGDDRTKPGYMAKLDDFQAGQEVKLTLAAPKKADKDAAEEVARPTVSMVVITKNTTSPGIQGGTDKKKKK